MNKMKLTLVIVMLLIGTILVSGCIGASDIEINSQEDVSNVVTDVSSDMEDVSSILDDIDQGLG